MQTNQVVSFVAEVVKVALIALIIVIPIRTFIFQPFIVKGASMEPNFHSGDYLVIDELSYQFRGPQREEVIVFKFPGNQEQRYIKRVIGLPGEKVEVKTDSITVYPGDGTETIVLDESSYLPGPEDNRREATIVLGPTEYFVLGDNRPFSSDSRSWGALPRELVIGRVLVKLWPLPSLMAATDSLL